MYRYVVNKLRQAGVNNVVYVWNTMGYYGHEEHLDALYPGHDYVDWMCYDPYMRDDKTDNLAMLVNNPHPDIGWPGYYNWATAKAPGKPMMLCEWGVSLNSNDNPASKLAGDAGQMLAAYPMLKGLVFWNDVGEGNYRLDEPSAKATALGAAFRQLAAHPYFNSTSTAARRRSRPDERESVIPAALRVASRDDFQGSRRGSWRRCRLPPRKGRGSWQRSNGNIQRRTGR